MKVSLGALLATGLAGLQLLAVLVVVFSSYVTSERALMQHARELLRDVGVNTIEHAKSFLSPAEGAAELAARLAQNRVIASDNPQLLERLLFQQLQITPQFAGLYYGAEDGSFVYVMRSPEGPGPFRTKIISRSNDRRSTQLIWRNDSFAAVAEESDPQDDYDPRDRLWYKQAHDDLTTIWTDPYIFFSSQQPGITLAAPVLRDDGGVRGVVGVDIEISMISGFLSRLNIGDTGRAMIIHRNGDVIAHPRLELIKARKDDGTLRFASITEFGDPIARAALAPLARDGDVMVAQEIPSQFIYQGASYVSTVMPVGSDKLPWTIAVYAPEADFTADIKQNRTTNIWIAVLVAAITGLVGLALADYIHKPVRAFAVRSALISQGEIDPDAPPPKTYQELERANASLVQQIVARHESEHKYGQTFDLSSRGMAQISHDRGAVIRANARFCLILGYSPDEITGLPFSSMIHPEHASHWHLSGCPNDSDLAINQEIRCLRRDGAVVWVTINAIVIRDQRGRALHAMITMDDITRGKERENQIKQLNRDISHLARGNTMGQMAAGLAHELNQPLTAIAQNADTALLVLSQHPGYDPELHDILAEIERESLRAGDIIRALRGFIRKDEGAKTVFDFAALLEQTLHLIRAEAIESGVSVEAAPDVGLPQIEANRVQIAQVLVNLLRNGIEAIAPTCAPERRVTVRARISGGMVTVSVEDTGPGIPEGFSLFTQFETGKPGGLGLGLSICRSIVEANGGRLWHDRGFSPGARLLFTLPVHRMS